MVCLLQKQIANCYNPAIAFVQTNVNAVSATEVQRIIQITISGEIIVIVHLFVIVQPYPGRIASYV